MQKGFEQGREEGFKLGLEEGWKIGWEEGIEEGRKLGMQEEAAYLVLLLIKCRFGNLSQNHQERIQGLSRSTLEDLAVALLDFTSVADLEIWLSRVELYSTLRDLPRLEKLKAMQFLIAELAFDEAPSLQGATNSVWSGFNSHSDAHKLA